MALRPVTPGTSTPGSPVEGDDSHTEPIDLTTGPFGIPMGLVKNVFSEGVDIAAGMGQLLGSAMHDLQTAGRDILPFVDDAPEGYLTPGVGKAMVGYQGGGAFDWKNYDIGESPIVKDYAHRYGPLVEGDVPGFLREQYEHPLSFGLDALTVATAGGAVAGKAAKLASLSPKVKAGVESLKVASGGADAAGILRRANAAGRVLPDPDSVGRMARAVRSIQGSAVRKWNPVTNRVDTVLPQTNPVRRALTEQVYGGITSVAGDKAARLADKYMTAYHAAGGAGGGSRALKYLDKAQSYRKALEQAGEGMRITRVGWAKRSGKKYVDWAVGYRASKAERTLAEMDEAVDELLSGEADVVGEKDAVLEAQGTQTLLTDDDVVPSQGAGSRRMEQLGTQLPQAPVDPANPIRWNEPDLDQPGPAAKARREAGEDITGGQVTDEGIERVRQAATEDVLEVVPTVQDELKGVARVFSGPTKTLRSIKRKAESILGTANDVTDVGRTQVVADGVWSNPGVAQDVIDRILRATGAKRHTIDDHTGVANPDGSRNLTLTVELPNGHPMEFDIMPPQAKQIIDATGRFRDMYKAFLTMKARSQWTPDDARVFTKMEMLSQHLWSGMTDQLREELGGSAAAPFRKKMNQFRVRMFGALTDPMLEKGLSIESVFDNAFAPLRMAQHGARRTEDGIAGGPGALTIDRLREEAGEMPPIYTPLMDVDQLPTRQRWLERGSGSKAVQDRNLAQNMGELLERQKFSTDFREIWHVRAQQASRLQERMDVLFDVVAHNGRALTDPNDYDPNTEVLFAPGLAKRMQNTHNRLLDTVADDPTGKSLVQLMEQLQVEDAELVAKMVANGGDEVVFAVPKFVAKRLNEHATWMKSSELQLFFGTPMKMWRAAVLATPRLLLNNMAGNTALLKLQGGSLLDVVKQVSPRARKVMMDRIGELADEELSGGLARTLKTRRREWDDATVGGAVAERIAARAGKNPIVRGIQKYADFVQRVNSGMEDAFRRASYLTEAERVAERAGIEQFNHHFWGSKKRLEAAFQVGTDEKLWKEAINGVDKTLNDYRTMTPFGRNIVRPFIAPFWSFYRHASKTMLTMPWEHPAKAQLLRILAEMEEEKLNDAGFEDQPAWMKGSSIFLGQGEADDYRFMSTAGVNPFNAVVEQPFNLLAPPWKMVYENMSGRDSFTGREFSDPNVKPGGFGSETRYRIDPETGEPTPVETVVPGFLEQALSQVPQYDMVKDLVAGGNTYDTTNLWTAIQSRVHDDPGSAVPLDSETGEPFTKRNAADTLMKLLGYTEYSTDLQEFNERQLEEKQAALDAWLEENG
jgi:hypothetical protein